MEAKITPGAPQDAEKWSKNFSGGPPAGTSEFCFAPGGLQERSGADLYSAHVASWQPPGARGVPGGLRELILIICGTVFAPCWALVLPYLEQFWALFWDLPGGEKQQRQQQKQQRKQQKHHKSQQRRQQKQQRQ